MEQFVIMEVNAKWGIISLGWQFDWSVVLKLPQLMPAYAPINTFDSWNFYLTTDDIMSPLLRVPRGKRVTSPPSFTQLFDRENGRGKNEIGGNEVFTWCPNETFLRAVIINFVHRSLGGSWMLQKIVLHNRNVGWSTEMFIRNGTSLIYSHGSNCMWSVIMKHLMSHARWMGYFDEHSHYHHALSRPSRIWMSFTTWRGYFALFVGLMNNTSG